jgi:repressor LexA
MTEDGLSTRQRDILGFIASYTNDHGYPPSVRDIGKATGLASASTVHSHLTKLESAGLLRRDKTKPRAIELLTTANQTSAPRAQVLPVVGRIAAGRPVLAEENIEEYVEVSALFGGDQSQYVLRVSGDSMKDAGILAGDYVVVKPQPTAQDGEIVVALVGDEATVKRFYKERDCIRLQPENPDMEAIRSRAVEVIGIVCGLYRKIA